MLTSRGASLHKSVRTVQPAYLSDLLHRHAPVRQHDRPRRIYWLSPKCAPRSADVWANIEKLQ